MDAVAAAQVLKPDKGAPPPGTAHWLAQPRALGGHFAGIPFALDSVDTGRWNWRLPTPVGTQMAIELQALERVLAERASALGVCIERGRAVEAVQAGEAEVVIETADGVVRGRWLVGCDGGRSTVRKQCGFSFVGTDPEFTGHSLLVELEDPSVLTPGRQNTAQGMFNFNPPGVLALADFDGGLAIARPSIWTLRRLCCGACPVAMQRSRPCICTAPGPMARARPAPIARGVSCWRATLRMCIRHWADRA